MEMEQFSSHIGRDVRLSYGDFCLIYLRIEVLKVSHMPVSVVRVG